MVKLDKTHEVLIPYLQTTESIMNKLLCQAPYYGYANIIPNIDLGFPHDVIRLAGGFATGIYLNWDSDIPFVPIDICMNACTVSLYKLNDDNPNVFSEKSILSLLSNLENSSYKANFHRGNHFVSYVESVIDKQKCIFRFSSKKHELSGLYPRTS